MKLSAILALSVFLMVLVVELILIGHSNFINNNIFNERIKNDLITIAKLNSNHAGILLQSYEDRIRVIAERDFLEEIVEETSKREITQNEIDRLLNELNEIKENTPAFEEVHVVGLDSRTIISTNPTSIGEKINVVVDFLAGEENTEVSGSYYSDFLKKNVIYVSSKIISDEGESVLGALVVVLSLKEMAEIVSAEGLGETGESYVVNDEGFFITPSKFLRGENKGVLTQQINTKNYEECFEHKAQGITKHTVYEDYLDYRGKKSIGTHAIIPESEWCLIVKIDSDEIFEISRDVFLKNQVVLAVIILAFITLLAFSLGGFIDNRIKIGGLK